MGWAQRLVEIDGLGQKAGAWVCPVLHCALFKFQYYFLIKKKVWYVG